MARILYGVHGTGHGHAIRALAVARHFAQHEFQFVSHGDGAALLRPHFPVFECINPETRIAVHRVRSISTAVQTARVMAQAGPLVHSVAQRIDRFQPDAALTDYEFFVPLACRRTGIPCVSLDHQHIITFGDIPVPPSQRASCAMTAWAIRHLFSHADYHLITSFFSVPLRDANAPAAILPPLVRDQLVSMRPSVGEHVVAYQGYDTFRDFLPFLEQIRRPVHVYGLNRTGSEGALRFRPYSEQGFLEDLASCAYVVCGGGHTLTSEALYFHKPVLSFPIRNAFEQYLNASQLERAGYGQMLTTFHPPAHALKEFEARLDGLRARIEKESFFGNEEIFRRLTAHFERRKGPAAPAGTRTPAP